MPLAENRRFLSIDYGERRIGLAKSDPSGTIASALITIEVSSMAEAVKKIAEKISEIGPDGIVIGYPLHISGEKSEKCLEVDKFVEKLEEIYKKPIHKVDERWSSAEAADIVHAHGKKIGQDKGRIDRLSAVIILQRFLDGED
ncbi:MAG: Holliday junction resolvase RuvX [candidate division Zixibacteria bacterium]|nr:Holliday junction resolvase RuvX [candidate division Zixibacteria bacterium]